MKVSGFACLIAITCSTARADDAGCPHPSQAQIDHYKEWQAERQQAASLHRWGTRVLAVGTGILVGVMAGVVTSGHTLTIDSGSPLLYIGIGTVVVSAGLDIAGSIENPGAYHPLVNDPTVKTVTFAWKF
jgi:hypothetical protein